jgi:hypothetical protein
MYADWADWRMKAEKPDPKFAQSAFYSCSIEKGWRASQSSALLTGFMV